MPFLFFDDNFVTHSGIRITNISRLREPLSLDMSEVALIEGSILELTGGFSSKFDNIAAGLQMYMQSCKRSDINLCIQSIRWVLWSIHPTCALHKMKTLENVEYLYYLFLGFQTPLPLEHLMHKLVHLVSYHQVVTKLHFQRHKILVFRSWFFPIMAHINKAQPPNFNG